MTPRSGRAARTRSSTSIACTSGTVTILARARAACERPRAARGSLTKLRRSDAIVACSQAMANELREFDSRIDGLVRVVHNAIDSVACRRTARRTPLPDALEAHQYLLSVGKFETKIRSRCPHRELRADCTESSQSVAGHHRRKRARPRRMSRASGRVAVQRTHAPVLRCTP